MSSREGAKVLGAGNDLDIMCSAERPPAAMATKLVGWWGTWCSTHGRLRWTILRLGLAVEVSVATTYEFRPKVLRTPGDTSGRQFADSSAQTCR